jgi:hypothetical protein
LHTGGTIFDPPTQHFAVCRCTKKTLPTLRSFTKGGKVTYEIIDGVRRAKAAEFLGKETIVAKIYDENDKLLDIKEISIDSLFSPNKLTIDFFTEKSKDRFMETLNLAKSGSTPPPIFVTPGCKGPKICDVTLDSYGD